jgi:hypothetical protein
MGFRARLFVVFFANLAALPLLADPDPTFTYVPRLLSLNGITQMTHPDTLSVRPGEVIFLSGDLIGLGGPCGQGCLQSQSVEDFVWGSSLSPTDECDPADIGSCFSHSNFEANDYGVSFYVPYQLKAPLTVSLRHKTYSTWDSITLVNALGGADEAAPPPHVVTHPDEYHSNYFDFHYALQGQGNWIVLEKKNYFVPYVYDENWEPYQNGYWAWVKGFGWNWLSFDPWSWVTDHYGIWRHHRTYGWIWMAYDKTQYHPSSVTWFFGNGYVGWYPYNANYPQGYREGWEAGFNDGFEYGYQGGNLYDLNSPYHGGHTVVASGNFNAWNIHAIKVSPTNIFQYWKYSYATRLFGPLPGNQTLQNSKPWMEAQIGGAVALTALKTKAFREQKIVSAIPLYGTSPEYRAVAASLDPKNRPPLGAIVKPGVLGNPVVLPPTENEKGIVFPLKIEGPDGNPMFQAPRTNRPALPSKLNPVFHLETIPPQATPPAASHPHPLHPSPLPHPQPVL